MTELSEREALKAALVGVINQAWALLDDTANADAQPEVPKESWFKLSEAMDVLEALIPNAEQPCWPGVAVRLFGVNETGAFSRDNVIAALRGAMQDETSGVHCGCIVEAGCVRNMYRDPEDAASAFFDTAADAILALRPSVPQDIVEALEDIMEHFADRDQGPGHGHSMPGIWDDDVSNGERRGQPCDWCAKWNRARTALSKLSPDEGSAGA